MPKRGIPVFPSTTIHHHKKGHFKEESEVSLTVAEPAAEPTAEEQAPAAGSDGRDGPGPDATAGADGLHAVRSVPAQAPEAPGGASTHYVGLLVHGKSSSREGDKEALSKAGAKSQLTVEEVHKDSSGNDLPMFSLREIHKSADGHAGAIDLGRNHTKRSEEKDATNPAVEPERWIPPPREELAPPAPPTGADGTEIARPGAAAAAEEVEEVEVEFERVNAAPDPPADAYEECTPVDGRYRHPSSGGKAGSGVVIRYQYELIQSTRSGDGGGIELVDDILPRLEEGITDKLLPVFFGECSGAAAPRHDSRGLAGEGGLRRRLGGGEVVGIDAHPADVAIGGECEVYTVRDPFQTTTCHRIEGSLTLFFPPNAAVSSLLRPARLSALRAVAAGMEDGSLNGSHEGIRSLIFLDSSHRLDAILPPDEVAAEPEVAKSGGRGNGGFIALGVTVSVFLLAACVFGFVLYRRAPFQLRVKMRAASPRRRGRRESSDEEEGKLVAGVVEPSKKERRKRKGRSKKSRSRGRPSSGNGADADVGSADGAASRVSTQSDHDGGSSAREEDTATASDDEDQASDSADEEVVGGGALYGPGPDSSSSDEDDDFDASSNVLYSTFESSLKEEARKARERKLERRRARIRRRLKRHNRRMNRSVVVAGGGGGEEESVATGVSAGVHSVSSAATDMVRNSAGVTRRDDASVMTGVSAATEKAGNVVPRY